MDIIDVKGRKYIQITIGTAFSSEPESMIRMDILVPENRKDDFDRMINKNIELQAKKMVKEKVRHKFYELIDKTLNL